MSNTITAQQLLDIVQPIPKEKWITGEYEESGTQCRCFLGHVNHHFFGHAKVKEDELDGNGAPGLVKRFFLEMFKVPTSVIVIKINDTRLIYSYTESHPKNRIIHLLQDMIKRGY